MKRTWIAVCFAVAALSATACGQQGPAPTPTPSPTRPPLTASQLEGAALTVADLPSGYVPMDASDTSCHDYPPVVTTDFPNAKVIACRAYGLKAQSGTYDSVVVAFVFSPLSTDDITKFDTSDASKLFAHGNTWGGSGGTQIMVALDHHSVGDYSATLTFALSTKQVPVNEVVGRRGNVGFTALVMGVAKTNSAVALTAAKAIDGHIQSL
jgi:hypothetical protein